MKYISFNWFKHAYYLIVNPSDDTMSLAKINDTQGVFTIHDQRVDGNYIAILKFDMTHGTLLENYSIDIDYYPSGTNISNGNLLNIYGYSPTQDKVAFIRVI